MVIKRALITMDDEEGMKKFATESLISLLLARDVRRGLTPNFPAINDVFSCGANTYTLMERLDSFEDLLNDDPSEQLLENLLFQVLAAMYFMQEKYQMTHQDLKPDNVMIRRVPKHGYLNYRINNRWYQIPNLGLVVVILDFGFATFKYKDKYLSVQQEPEIFEDKWNVSDEYRPLYDLMFFMRTIFDNDVYRVLDKNGLKRILDLMSITEFHPNTGRPIGPFGDGEWSVWTIRNIFRKGPDAWKKFRKDSQWPFVGKGWFSF